MASSSSSVPPPIPRQVLAVGLSSVPTPWTGAPRPESAGPSPEQLRASILASFNKAADLGCAITIKQTLPLEIFSFPIVVKEALQERAWDGFIIGFGIRGVAEYTAVFEQLVNAARVYAPQAKFGFNTRPDNLDETLIRMFGGE